MLDWLWRKSAALASWRSFGVLWTLTVVFVALFHIYGANYPESSFDGHQYGASAGDIARILQNFDRHQQLDQYLAQETQLDLTFPAVYGLFFAVVIAGLKPRWRWLVAIPYATALFDYCENTAFIALVLRYRKTHSIPAALATAASVASRLKWIFMGLLLAALAVALVDALLRAAAAARARSHARSEMIVQ
jgi:hypothetical protein